MVQAAVAPIGVAVVGLDHWYNAFPFIAQVTAHPRFRLVAIAHGDAQRAASAVAQAGSGFATTDPLRAISDGAVDVVASFTTVDRNAHWCRAAAQHGKHVLAGKPLAMTIADAKSAAEAAETAGTLVFPFESYGRVTNLYRTIKRWIDEGRVGEVLSIDCRHDAALPISWHDDPTPGWWTDAAHNPGGGWIDHAIYQIDVIRHLTGREVERIEGRVATVHHDWLPFEDDGSAEIHLSGGTRCTSRAHWLVPQGTFRRQVDVIGSEGMILYDNVGDTVRLRSTAETGDDAGPPDATLPPAAAELQRPSGWRVFQTAAPDAPGLLDHVANVLEGREPPAATAHDGVANLDAALRFYAAARTG